MAEPRAIDVELSIVFDPVSDSSRPNKAWHLGALTRDTQAVQYIFSDDVKTL